MLTTELIPAAERTSRRLLVVLHGLGDSLEGYRWLPGALGLPWMNYLLVNAPNEHFGGFSWYEFPGDASADIARSAALLFELLDQQRDLGFPADQTALFGFSQGSLMTVEVGLRYSHRLAGLVGVSGYIHDPETLLGEMAGVAREQRLLLTHGVFDPLIPFAAVREQVNLLKAEGLQVEWHEFRKEHTIAGEAEVAVIRQFLERVNRV